MAVGRLSNICLSGGQVVVAVAVVQTGCKTAVKQWPSQIKLQTSGRVEKGGKFLCDG